MLPGSRFSVREGREPAVAVLARVRICARWMAAAAAAAAKGASWTAGGGGGGGGCGSMGAVGPNGTSLDDDARPGDAPLWDRWSMRGPAGFEGGTGCMVYEWFSLLERVKR